MGLVSAHPDLLAQTIILDAEGIRHPYDIALEYCSARGGLVLYSVRKETVEFNCSDGPAAILAIRQP